MYNHKSFLLTALTVAVIGLSASAVESAASQQGKPGGIRPFATQDLTLRPYVSFSAAYDSNVDSTKKATGDTMYIVDPGIDIMWKADKWSLDANAWYSYHAYGKYNSTLGENSYGEALTYKWSNLASGDGKRGWTLMLAERYASISQSDDFTAKDGRGIWRDRETVDVDGAIERQITSMWHFGVNGAYNYLHYKNDSSRYAPLYGWSEWTAGAENGIAFTQWTDWLVDVGYSRYTSDGDSGVKNYDNNSQSWTAQTGLGTHATKRLSYRALLGGSWFDYGSSDTTSGWTYSLSANWAVIPHKLSLVALGSSYYQPSERDRGTAIKVYSLSTGFNYYQTDQLTWNGDIAWRHEQNIYSDANLASNANYDEDILSARLGVNWAWNQWVVLFARVEWESEMAEDRSDYNYNRFRGTVGVRLQY